MEIKEVSSKEYATIIKNPDFVYESAKFNNLNTNKCDSVYYLLFKDEHYRMGIIGGIKNNIFRAPFSAPFSGFSFLRDDLRLAYIDLALDLLLEWSKKHNLSGIYISFHPSFYKVSQLSKLTNCLYRKSFKIAKIDLNYYYKLENFNDLYINHIWKEARNNLTKAFKNQLVLQCCDSYNEKVIAFEIIKQNKKLHGYPLHLTLKQIIETSENVKCDFFLVRDSYAQPIASAIIFHVSSEIVQVIYWGDLREYSNLRTMNFLSFKIFEYYKILGKKLVDLGPSTDCSVPNFGLCVFKESIGCDITTKFSFSLGF